MSLNKSLDELTDEFMKSIEDDKQKEYDAEVERRKHTKWKFKIEPIVLEIKELPLDICKIILKYL